MIVVSVKKSRSWALDNALAVVRFSPSVVGNSKFAAGSLADSETYSLTYDLSVIYGKECVDDDGKFDANAAFKTFKDEMKVGADEPVNGYEFSISELSGNKFDAVEIKANGRIMRTMRPACYGDRNKARLLAENNLRAQLAKKAFVIHVNEEKADDETDEEE